MSTIRVTNPGSPCDIDPGCFNNSYDEPPWKRDLGGLLIKLGQKIFEHDVSDDWLPMSKVSALCRRYRLQWRGNTTRAKDLDYLIRCYLDDHGEIMGGGVKVDYRTEDNLEKRHQQYSLRFKRMTPDGHLY